MSGESEDRGIGESGSGRLRRLLLDLSDPEARAAYLALWEKSPQRTPFAHPAFADVACAAFGFTGRIVGVPGEGPAWRAAALVFERRAGPLRVAAAPPLAPYVAPLLDGPLDAAAAHARRSPLDALAGGLGAYVQATLVLPPSHADARPLAWAGWRLETRYTYVSPLPAGADPAAWSENVRRTARKSAGGYRIEEDARHAGAAAALMREAFARHGLRFRVDDAAAGRVAHALAGAGLARVFAALPAGGGEPEAALVAALDGRTAFYWIAGSRPGPAMTALLAHALPRLAEAGVEAFDWCGANTPAVAEFKRKFGPALVPHVRARWVRPGPARLLDRLRGG